MRQGQTHCNIDEWAETTGAKVESDVATIAHRVEAIKSATDKHHGSASEAAVVVSPEFARKQLNERRGLNSERDVLALRRRHCV